MATALGSMSLSLGISMPTWKAPSVADVVDLLEYYDIVGDEITHWYPNGKSGLLPTMTVAEFPDDVSALLEEVMLGGVGRYLTGMGAIKNIRYIAQGALGGQMFTVLDFSGSESLILDYRAVLGCTLLTEITLDSGANVGVEAFQGCPITIIHAGGNMVISSAEDTMGINTGFAVAYAEAKYEEGTYAYDGERWKKS